MSEREQLQRAIAALEAQRDSLGDEVVNTGLAPMREKLAALERGERATRPGGEGERRIVTVLFCDVTGSTAMADRLDPEVWRDIMNAAFEILNEAVDRFDGQVVRLMGDAILAFFGAPVAHEDDPQRAVSAGLAVLEGIQPLRQQLQRERDLEFNVRVGINTGLVVVGDVGSTVREEYTAMGDAVNLAARMEQTAAPGTVQITEDTYRLVAPYFDARPLGGVVVKGKSEPVAAYQVMGEAAEPGPARGLAAHGIHSPLVGREVDMAAASQAIARLRQGQGGILLIFGEAGIGKTRLLAELFQAAATTSLDSAEGESRPPEVRWLEGHAQSFGQSISFWPFLEILREIAVITEEDSDQQAWLKLEMAVQNLFREKTAEVLPYLAIVLNLAVPAAYAERVRYLDGEAMGNQITLAFGDLFQELSLKQPLVLVFEDLHWVDNSSARLIERLLPLVEASPLLICGLSRPLPESPAIRLDEVAAADYGPYYTEVRLVPLADADSSRLVKNLLEIDDLPLAVHERIIQKADGNPYFLEEIIRNLIEAGLVVHNPATGRWQATGEIAAIAIPDTIQGVIMARVDRLDEAVKAVLRAAAVIGRIFLYRILNQVLPENERLDRQLAELTSVELIRELQSVPELEYMFKHALARDAIYESILRRKRRHLHAQAGQVIETLFAGRLEESYGLLAYHFTAAGDWEKAQHYLFQVGDKAQGMAADAEALAHYRRAMAAYEQAFGEPMASVQRASVERKMGEAYFRLGRFEESQALLSSAVALLDRPIPASRLEMAIGLAGQILRQLGHRLWPNRYLGKAPEVKKMATREALLAYQRLGVLALFQGETFGPGELYIGLRSLNLAEMSGYPQDMVRGYAIIAIGAAVALDTARPVEYYLRLAREVDQKHDDALAHALFLNNWGNNRLSFGLWDEANETLLAAADAYQRIGIDLDWELMRHDRAFVLRLSGQWDLVPQIRREVMASAERRGNRQMILWTLIWMAEDSLRQGGPGQDEELIGLLDRAERLLAENPNAHDEIHVQSLMAQAHYRRGDLEAAHKATATAMTLIQSGRRLVHPHMTDTQAGLPLVTLSLWETALAGRFRAATVADSKKLAGDAIKFFRGLIRIQGGYVRPRASLFQGTYDWLAGKQRRARKAWAKGLALAEEWQMPYEQGLAHFEMGRHRPVGDPGREQHLQQAAAIFSQLDAAWNLALVTAVLPPD